MKNEYIVKVKDPAHIDGLVQELATWNVKVHGVSKVGFIGFSANLTNLLTRWYSDDARIESIEKGGYYELQTVQLIETEPMWYLDRIDQPNLPLSGAYTYLNTGAGVTLYTIDSGISPKHTELSGKVVAINDPNQTDMIFDPIIDQRIYDGAQANNDLTMRGVDEIGHGTFIAGLLVSNTYGVAKNAQVRSAKVFGEMTASSGRILAGLNAISADYVARGKPSSILTVSFAGLAPSVSVTSNGNNAPTPSSFNLNGNTVSLITGTPTEIVTRINQLGLAGITASQTNGRVTITRTTLGSIVLTDGVNSPLAAIGITPTSYQNAPTLVEQALINLVNDGMHVVISASNYGIDANLVTPARISTVCPAITVGSTDKTDTLADFSKTSDHEGTLSNISFSNLTNNPATKSSFGSAVNIYAPGVSMQSTWKRSYNTGSDAFNEVMVSSGTSFSAPLVAGALALVLETTAMIPTGLRNFILNNSVSGVVSGLPAGSYNRLLNITSIDSSIVWVNYGPFTNVDRYSYHEYFLEAKSYRGIDVTYNIESGALPSGLVLESSTGRIYGIVDNLAPLGSQSVVIKAYDGSNNSQSDTNGVQVIEFDIVEGTQPAKWYTNPDLGTIMEGDSIDVFLSAANMSNPTVPIEFSVYGNLPYDWILVGDQIMGVAPMATNGDFETGFTISAWDGVSYTQQTFTLTIGQIRSYDQTNEPKWITPTGTLGSFTEDTEVVIQLLAEDDPALPLPLTFNLSCVSGDGSVFEEFGELPPGMVLNPDTGTISGTMPLVTGGVLKNYEFAVYLSDGANVVVNYFSITVLKQNAYSAPIWYTPEGLLASLELNQNVGFQLIASDLTGLPIAYYLMSGSLPSGLILDQNGLISGSMAVNTDDLFVFTVLASNGYLSTPRTFSIKGVKNNRAPQWNMDGDLGDLDEGLFINIPLVATDLDGDDLSFYSNDLIPSLYIQGSYLQGTLPSVDDDTEIVFNITVTDVLSNADNPLEDTQEFTINVVDGALNPNTPPVWMTPEGPLPSGITNTFYATSLIAVDPEGENVYYQIAGGNFPPGLELDQYSGNISGTIGSITDDTGYDFNVSASDGVFTVTRAFNIFVSSATVNQPPVWITQPNLGTIYDGQSTTISFIANDPEGTVITYSVVGGVLPPGMLFNTATGQLSGVPSIGVDQISYQFIIRATDAGFVSTDQSFSVLVVRSANLAPVWITPTGQLNDVTGFIEYHTGDYVDFQFQSYDPDDGPLPLSYRIATGSSLPYTLTLDTSGRMTGYVGTVYSIQEINFTVEVSDGVNVVPRTFMIKFVPTPAYEGISTDLYVPLSADLVKMIKEWNVDALIPDSILYEPDSTDYGRSTQYDILVAKNIHTGDKNEIQDILEEHHKAFSALMGIPTYAVGKDNLGNPVYEVIYIPMLDPQEGSDFDIPNQDLLEYYSHSFDNIRTEVLALENNEVLPSWMRSPQDAQGTILGYVPAVVLAYVQPGSAKNLVDTFTQIINQTSFNIQETTFDRHVLLAETVDPVVNAGDQMVVEGIVVTFSGGDVFSARDDIEAALLNAGVTSIRAYVENSVIYQYTGSIFGPVYGNALRFNYSNNYLTLSNLVGTPCEDLGFKAQTNVETTFDGQTVHFDYSLILDERQNIQSSGLTFVGKELAFDRYVGISSDGNTFQVKWAPDYQERFYDSHKKEFWSKNPPVFITPPGELGPIVTALPVTIQLRTKHHLADQSVSYKVVFGSLPEGFTLNSDTGMITGVAGGLGETTFFTVRAYDKWGNHYDRGFTLSTGPNLLRINQFIILINGDGISIGGDGS